MKWKIFFIVITCTLSLIVVGFPQLFDNSQVSNNGANESGWIGAQLTDLSPTIREHLNYTDSYGIYIQDTIRNSPAQTAGLLPGDIITHINHIELTDVLPTINLINTLQPGNKYPVTIFRTGKYLHYEVIISPKTA